MRAMSEIKVEDVKKLKVPVSSCPCSPCSGPRLKLA